MAARALKSRRFPNLYCKRGTWWYARQVNGIRPWVNLQTGDEAEAVRRVAELERAPLLRVLTSGLQAEVQLFVAYKLGRRAWSRESAASKRLILGAFADWLPPETTSADVSTQQLQRFYEERRRVVSDATAESNVMTLRSFFRWAVEVRRTRLDNPAAKLEVVHAERVARKRFADKKTKNRLQAAAPDDDLRFILFCGFDAGLRRGEISEARADWFDLGHGSLHVQRSIGARLRRFPDGHTEREWRPKYNKERIVPLTRPFLRFVRRYLRGREPLDFALHPEIRHGEWRYRYDFRRPFEDYMRAQGMVDPSSNREEPVVWLTPHVMRHSFASILKTAGESNAKIAEWLGDTERVTEQNYSHLRPDDRGIHALS